MSIRKKWLISGVVAVVVLLVETILGAFVFLAVDNSPNEATTRVSEWKTWTAQHFGRSFLMALLIAIVIFILSFFLIDPIWNRIRPKTAAEKLWKRYGPYGFTLALWGEGLINEKDKWLDRTFNKGSLVDRVRSLLALTEREPAIRVNHSNLEVASNFRSDISKKLLLVYPNGSTILLDMDEYLVLRSDMPVGHTDLAEAIKHDPSQAFYPNEIANAEWFAVDNNGKIYLEDKTKSGEDLAIKVKLLFNSNPPTKLENSTLDVRDPKVGPHKQLRIRLADGRCFSYDEYSRLTVDSAVPIAPFEPRTRSLSPSGSSGSKLQSRINRDNPGRTFEILVGQFGRIGSRGQRFTDNDFHNANPTLPPNISPNTPEADDYYEEIIQGHLNRNPPAIRIVEPGT